MPCSEFTFSMLPDLQYSLLYIFNKRNTTSVSKSQHILQIIQSAVVFPSQCSLKLFDWETSSLEPELVSGFRAGIHVSTVCALCSQETCGDLSHVKLYLEPSLLEHQCPLKWILISNLGSVWTLSWWICKYLLISLTYTGGKSPPEHIWNAGHPRSEDAALLTLWNIPELFLHTENYAC